MAERTRTSSHASTAADADRRTMVRRAGWSLVPLVILGIGLLLLLVLPLLALVLTTPPARLLDALQHPLVGPALGLSLRTSVISLVLVVIGGTPLAWWLARTEHGWARVIESVVELPIVVPPAVVGIGLLLAVGREGLLGPLLAPLGWSIPFTSTAVVLAQTVVAAPFYVRSATEGFRAVDDDLLLVARTLGASRVQAVVRVAIPVALPALLGGAALCWARAVGEFGATLLLAGNLPGTTQTMPLAIYSALETDIAVANAIALVLGMIAFATLVGLRLVQGWRRGRRPSRAEALPGVAASASERRGRTS